MSSRLPSLGLVSLAAACCIALTGWAQEVPPPEPQGVEVLARGPVVLLWYVFDFGRI